MWNDYSQLKLKTIRAKSCGKYLYVEEDNQASWLYGAGKKLTPKERTDQPHF